MEHNRIHDEDKLSFLVSTKINEFNKYDFFCFIYDVK